MARAPGALGGGGTLERRFGSRGVVQRVVSPFDRAAFTGGRALIGHVAPGRVALVTDVPPDRADQAARVRALHREHREEIGVMPLSVLASLPTVYAPAPFVVASARGRDGTRLLIAQTPDDPTDVFLNVRHRNGPWIRFRLAYGDSLWSGRIDFAPGLHSATISAYDVLVAELDLDADRLEKVAPLTGFVGNARVVEDAICDPLMYDAAMTHVQCRPAETR